ncbi:CTSL [Cordylochernes scorpioides]|uniref:CTSL n=1 Tax=Cordylochernes scorpioides TaxID=51811 RepID=A0ABY6JX77_9ARAC|nr:CTSL [Cordylochernes scorpioides]
MKFLVALTLLALGSQCLARPTNDDDHHWERFKELHGKNYQGLEDQVRKAIFEEKLKKIAQHNLEYDLGMHSYYLGINKYSDWSSQEFTKHMNGLIVSEDHTMDLYEPSGDMELPSSLDWRSKGYVTGVKDQGDCGSCWAFSTTGALEGQHYRKSGKLVSLSEQNLVDCSTKNGCGGGVMIKAYKYIIKNGGIDTEESYPYKAEDDYCHYNKSNIGATCKGYKKINEDEESLKQALAAEGPISIGIDVWDNFIDYKGGLYNNPNCHNDRGSLNHAVLLVGYGQENGMDYWLVKNSWTESWGEKGYIKMSRNKNNQCGIATYATYPIV